MHEAVESVAINALQGLYLTQDMYVHALYMVPHEHDSTVATMHEVQPLTTDFDYFADHVNDRYHVWRQAEFSNKYLSPDAFVKFGHQMMAVSDLAGSYVQIRRGMLAACDLVLAIMLRQQKSDTYTAYRPAIPESLRGMQIDDINVDTYLRIFSVEPWVSWLARLRAQQKRTAATLADPHIVNDMQVMWQRINKSRMATKMPKKRALRRIDNQTRRTIRKSADMFQRFLGRDALNTFIHGDSDHPLLLSGSNYNYQLIKRPDTLFSRSLNLNTGTSTANTSIYNKAGDRLCDICVYFKGTPILDSVVATALHVQNPETELDFLNKACVIDTPNHFYDDPVLPEMKNLTDPALAPTLIDHVFKYADCQTTLRDSVESETLHHAYHAFHKINKPGRQYFPIMRLCGEYSVWNYLDGKRGAISMLHLARTHMAHGFK